MTYEKFDLADLEATDLDRLHEEKRLFRSGMAKWDHHGGGDNLNSMVPT